MKGRESGMPAKEMWDQFFKPEEVLKIMQVDKHVKGIAEFGCGYGTFTIPAAKLIQGTVYAIDIEKEMTALTEKDDVKIFLIGKGVEHQKISTEKFNTVEQAEKLLKAGGKIFACGTCIKSRNQEGTEMCPINTMKDMYEIIKESDKVVTF